MTFAIVGSIAFRAIQTPNTILLGVGTIRKGELAPESSLATGVQVVGVRGPFSRDAFLSKYGINPEIVGDPGLYLSMVFQEEIKVARQHKKSTKELCFISHVREKAQFSDMFKEFKHLTISAGGNIRIIVKFMATCKAVVSSSLHGVVFSHSMSIPAVAIKVSEKIAGGDWKFYDYYYGINVTTFRGRIDVRMKTKRPETIEKWVKFVNQFPQPLFPLDVERLKTFRIFQSIFKK